MLYNCMVMNITIISAFWGLPFEMWVNPIFSDNFLQKYSSIICLVNNPFRLLSVQ